MSLTVSTLDLNLPALPDSDQLISDLVELGTDLADLVKQSVASRQLIAHIASGSPFLASLVRRYPAFTHDALTRPPAEVFADICGSALQDAAGAQSQPELMSRLRVARSHTALLVAVADISGVWDCDAVTAALTSFADGAVSCATNWLLEDAVESGKLKPRKKQSSSDGYVVLAMGKHGAGELNYSSDIDLIVLYDPEKAPLKDPNDAAQFYVRLTRQLVAILQDRTADGYVFRVDLRLRPDPRATQIAIGFTAACNYYESMGQNWERAAMIKARPVAGDMRLGEEFLRHLVPFVWRKYLDFAAIADVQSLKRQMHAHKGHAQIAVLGHNIKLGRGGIREIEFFVQTQQLIAGGRNPNLRGNRTLQTLQDLVAAQWLQQEACDQLRTAYVLLRTLEHRLQMVADEQTQTLPESPQQFARFALFCGYGNPQILTDEITRTLQIVQGHYAELFEEAPELASGTGNLVFTGGEDDPETLHTLTGMGFEQVAEVSATIRGWHFGRYPATRSAAARERLTELMPALLTALAKSGHPDHAFIAFDRFIAGLPAGVQLFSMFKANPFLLDLVATVLGTAPRLAQSLSRRPRQLEAVLDPSFFESMPSAAELTAAFEALSAPQATLEEILDAARVEAREKALRIGIRILSETVSSRQAGLAYSNLADAVLQCMLEVVRRDIAARHGQVGEQALVVVAMGKLGGQEMTAASDLDLIFLYDFAKAAETSDGEKPLAPSQYFARLTQRLVTAITSKTAEGDLYEVDMRLRPSGNKGPVATHVDGFENYQATEAWTWEKMALTRARVIAGDTHLQKRTEQIIRDVLCASRDSNQTLVDVAEMRARMLDNAGDSSHWDLKLVRGGLVDIEFIAQGLQLVHAHDKPQVLQKNTLDALQALRDEGILEAADHDVLASAASLYQSLTHILRLCTDARFDPAAAPPGLKNLLLRGAAAPDMATLEAQLQDAHASVSAIFDRLIVRNHNITHS